jgi:proteasome activator subunit 4
MYPAMENLTEPHRLIACMICIVAVARPMLQSDKWYPEGKSHVLPLLNLALPGIDPNDFKKCLVS